MASRNEAPDSTECDMGDSFVINRSGEREMFSAGRISDRNRSLCDSAYGARLTSVNQLKLTQEVISRVRSGITTRKIDQITIDVCRAMSGNDPDYGRLAARIIINNLHKQITQRFADIYIQLDERYGIDAHVGSGFLDLVRDKEIAQAIEERLVLSRDYMNSSFSVHTLMRSYLLRDPDGEIVELPQHMYMRIALQIHCLRRPVSAGVHAKSMRGGSELIKDRPVLMLCLEEAFATYELLSLKKISHATPTVINSGGVIPQMSSCFQVQAPDDLDGLLQVVKDTAMMSKTAGGVSITLDSVRADGARITSSGGKSSGIKHYMCLLQRSQIYANQGGTRPGAFAMYISPHHADVMRFLEMSLPRGQLHELREDAARLKYALWIPDRFFTALKAEIRLNEIAGEQAVLPPDEMEKLKNAAKWYLFSPDEAPGLEDVFDERAPGHPDGPGGAYSDLFDRYVAEKRYREEILPSTIMRAACKAIGQRGNPYLLAKDACNRQSNIAKQGRPVKSSNLCAEVTIPCVTRSPRPGEACGPVDENSTLYSVCNLAAINLATFVVRDVTVAAGSRVDFERIIDAAGALVLNLDNIIDQNYSDIEACHRSNQLFRAIGIGIMGLADVFAMLELSFGSPEALRLDAAIHAAIYYGAMRQSALLAQTRGSFPAFAESQAALGRIQPDLCSESGLLPSDWAKTVMAASDGAITCEMWDDLRALVKSGLRNGYVTALMPTATSSNAAGVNECFEPFTTHMYLRHTMAGEFTMLNTHLVRKLVSLKLWNEHSRFLLEADEGSIASWDGTNGRPHVDENIRRMFRTAREIDPREIIAHSVARNPFISQSQSLNHYRREISVADICEIALTGWESGLKTLAYYTHNSPSVGSQKTSSISELARIARSAEDAKTTPTSSEAPPAAACPRRRPGAPPSEDCSACSV